MKIVKGNLNISSKSSKGYVIGGWNVNPSKPKKQEFYSEIELSEFMDMFKNDPIVNAAVNTIVDAVMSKGYEIYSKNKQQIAKAKKLLSDLRFKKKLRQFVFQLVIYRNLFSEIEKDVDGKTASLNILEPTTIKIEGTQHGDIDKFVQEYEGKVVEWAPDDMFYIPLTDASSSIWGDIDVKSLMLTVNTKNEIESYIYYLFHTNKFRDWFNFEDAAEDQVKKNMAELLRLEGEPLRPYVTSGKVTHSTVRSLEELRYMVDLLNYYRSQILIQMQVPPIMVGLPDNSNRSNSETQVNKAFNTRIISIQDVLEEHITNDLFVKIGLKGVEFKFNSIDYRDMKDKIEIVGKLKDLGLDKDSLKYIMKNFGMNLPVEFDLQLEQQDKTMYPPSREPEDKSMPVKHETGSDSTTREEQISGKSLDTYYMEDQYAEYLKWVKNKNAN